MRWGLALALGTCTFFMYRENAFLTRLLKEGRVLQGRVISKKIFRTRSTSYLVEYSFSVDDKLYRDTESVKPELYDSVTQGSPVPVTIVPEDPSYRTLGRIDEATVGASRWWWILRTILVGLFIEVFNLYFEGEARRERIALSSQEAVPAKILKLDPESKTSKQTTATVGYQLPDGSEHTVDIRLEGHFPGIETGGSTLLFLNRDRPAKSVLLRGVRYYGLEGS